MKNLVWVIVLAIIAYAARSYFREPSWDAQFQRDPRAALAKVAEQLNKNKDKSLADLQFLGAEATQATLLTLSIKHPAVVSDQVDGAQAAAYGAALVDKLCRSDKFAVLFRHKVMVKYRVLGGDNEVLFVERISQRECMAPRAMPSETAEAAPTPTAQMKCREIPDQESRDACLEHWSDR